MRSLPYVTPPSILGCSADIMSMSMMHAMIVQHAGYSLLPMFTLNTTQGCVITALTASTVAMGIRIACAGSLLDTSAFHALATFIVWP